MPIDRLSDTYATVPWTAYTPTLAGTGWALGDGTASGVYCQVGKLIAFRALITFGSTSTFGTGSPNLTVPIALKTAGVGGGFTGYFVDSSTGSSYSYGAWANTTTTVIARSLTTAGAHTVTNSTTPFTWATGDQIILAGTYEGE